MVSICVEESRRCTISLPQSCAVRDLYKGQDITDAAKSFTVGFAAHETRVFLLKPNE